MTEQAPARDEVSQKSPFAGCAIVIAALAVMAFLIGFSIFSLFRQFGEIAKFTEEAPREIAIVSLEERESELNQLAEKLEAFRLALGEEDDSAELALDAEEINLAIAAYKAFEDLRGTFRVESITPEQMRLAISFKLNGKPRMAKPGEGGWMASDPRYLNGTMLAAPGLLSKEVVLQISDIEVEGKEVPEGFLGQMSPYRISERYAGPGTIGEAMAALTTVELGDGVVRFRKTAGEVAADTVTDADVDKASGRLFKVLGIVACAFLLLVAAILLIGMRLKKKRDSTVS